MFLSLGSYTVLVHPTFFKMSYLYPSRGRINHTEEHHFQSPFPTVVLAHVLFDTVPNSLFFIFHIFSLSLQSYSLQLILLSRKKLRERRDGGWTDRARRTPYPCFHPICSTLSIYSFVAVLSALLSSSSPPAGSSLLLSQGQAGLSFPNRSDRSLVTATVDRGDGGRERRGVRVAGGGCKG